MHIKAPMYPQATYPSKNNNIAMVTDNKKNPPSDGSSDYIKDKITISQHINGKGSSLKTEQPYSPGNRLNSMHYPNARVSDYSSQDAKIIGTTDSLVLVARSDEEFKAYLLKSGNASEMKALDQQHSHVLDQRKALYNDLVAQGKKPIEIISSILNFNLNLPNSYGESFDLTKTRPSGYYHSMQQQQLDRLNAAIKNSQT